MPLGGSPKRKVVSSSLAGGAKSDQDLADCEVLVTFFFALSIVKC